MVSREALDLRMELGLNERELNEHEVEMLPPDQVAVQHARGINVLADDQKEILDHELDDRSNEIVGLMAKQQDNRISELRGLRVQMAEKENQMRQQMPNS